MERFEPFQLLREQLCRPLFISFLPPRALHDVFFSITKDDRGFREQRQPLVQEINGDVVLVRVQVEETELFEARGDVTWDMLQGIVDGQLGDLVQSVQVESVEIGRFFGEFGFLVPRDVPGKHHVAFELQQSFSERIGHKRPAFALPNQLGEKKQVLSTNVITRYRIQQPQQRRRARPALRDQQHHIVLSRLYRELGAGHRVQIRETRRAGGPKVDKLLHERGVVRAVHGRREVFRRGAGRGSSRRRGFDCRTGRADGALAGFWKVGLRLKGLRTPRCFSKRRVGKGKGWVVFLEPEEEEDARDKAEQECPEALDRGTPEARHSGQKVVV